MAKKAFGFVLVVLGAAAGFYLYQNRNELGSVLNKPEPNYLSEEEAESRPVYQSLSRKEQAIYEALHRGISEHKEKIYLPYEIDGETYSRVYIILEKQEPEFFYLDSVYYTADKIYYAKIAYRDDAEKADKKTAELDEAKQKALKNLPDGSDYDKILYINNYLVENCKYRMSDDDEYDSTAYGCLVNGKAGCEGYSKAFQLLASEAGFETELITGVTDEGDNHAWNQIKADGKWYNIDVTWSDHDDGYAAMEYFLVDDKRFEKTHTADNMNFQPQTCSAVENNYYIKNNFEAESLGDAEKILESAFSSGNNFAEMQFSDVDVFEDFKKEYFDGEKVFEIAENCGVKIGNGTSVSIKENKKELSLNLAIE